MLVNKNKNNNLYKSHINKKVYSEVSIPSSNPESHKIALLGTESSL